MYKIIKDCIYGHIRVPWLCVKFMDVPEFQRLRRVRQLGMSHFAYPSAVHTRFEHCLGVMHLCGKMVDYLKSYVDISDRVKELIQLAGMYHDIGHFAYSHMFDSFLKKSNIQDPEIMKLHDHEDRSIYFLRKVNSRIKLLNDEEEQFVVNAIMGKIPDGHLPYLYQIVCNKECGVDVDKMDYLYRDSYYTGLPGFQSDYIMLCCVIDKDNHIAYKRKAYNEIKDLFDARRRMYENVYKHHTSIKMEKIHYCMMKRLGPKLFMYGDRTDDYNIDTLFRNSSETLELIQCIDNRNLDHECSLCKEYLTTKIYKPSGSIEYVRFV